MPPDIEFEEVPSDTHEQGSDFPEFRQFKIPGDTHTGKLVTHRTKQRTASDGREYTENLYDLEWEGTKYTVSAPSGLQTLLSKVPVGTIVQMKFEGTEKTKSGYDFKKFKVGVAKGTKLVEAVKAPF